MVPWKRNLWILWSGVLLSNASYGMVVPFLPLYLLKLGVSDQHVNMWSGVTFSVTFLVGAVMAPYWGSLADKYGKRRMVIRAGFSLAVVYMLGSLVQNPWELLGVRLLHGFVSGFVPASMSIVSTNTPEKQMGWALGLMQTAAAMGGILGPVMGGTLAALFGMRESFLIAGAIIFLGTVMVWLFVVEERFVSSERKPMVESLKQAMHNRLLVQVLLLLVIVQISMMILQPLLTLYIAQLQGGTDGAVLSSGIIFSIVGVAAVVASPFWGKLGQQKGYRPILLLALLAGGLLNLLQMAWANLYWFTVVRFMIGLFVSAVLPAINSIVVENTDKEFRGRAFGLTTSANQLGAMIGPLLGGALGGWIGIRSVFGVTGLLLLATALSTWFFIKNPAIEASKKTRLQQ